MKRNLAKFMAVALSVTTVLGTQTVAFAAEATSETGGLPVEYAWANTNFMGVTSTGVETVEYSPTRLDASNQISVTGKWFCYSNEQGSPDPVIVDNGDNTYNIIMYDDTQILLEVTDTARGTNMYADGSTEPFKYYMGDIEDLDVDIVKCCGMDSGTSRETVYYDELMAVYNQLECPLYLVELNARSVGSVVKHINYQDLSGVIQDCGITLNITVLPAQPGAQEPKYSGQQLADIKAKADAAAYAEWKRENADATWIYWFDVY